MKKNNDLLSSEKECRISDKPVGEPATPSEPREWWIMFKKTDSGQKASWWNYNPGRNADPFDRPIVHVREVLATAPAAQSRAERDAEKAAADFVGDRDRMKRYDAVIQRGESCGNISADLSFEMIERPAGRYVLAFDYDSDIKAERERAERAEAELAALIPPTKEETI